MATNKQGTTNYKRVFFIVLVGFIGTLGRWGYLKASNIVLEKSISYIQKKIDKKNSELASFSEEVGYDKLQYVKDIEKNNSMMPRSDHVNAIMAIFNELLDVDKSDTFNITFSNFEISLEKIKLDGQVTNLRLLYQGTNSKTGLIARFEELDFLDNISIKTYEKSDNDLGYDFTLTANVVNNGK